MLGFHPLRWKATVSTPQVLSKGRPLTVLPRAIVHLLVVGPQPNVLAIPPASVHHLVIAAQDHLLSNFIPLSYWDIDRHDVCHNFSFSQKSYLHLL